MYSQVNIAIFFESSGTFGNVWHDNNIQKIFLKEKLVDEHSALYLAFAK